MVLAGPLFWPIMFLFLLCHDDQSSSNNIDNYKACRSVLISIGMNDVWQTQYVENEKLFLFVAKQSLMDLAYQKIDSFVDNSNKCLIYKHLPKQRFLQQYLVKNMSPKCRKTITKLRVSAHKLSIETGRYDAVIRNITQTCPCNILQYFTAVKMIIFR